ncbi:alpha/beta-hydrolase [Periconia macrospinosa]|uniref:Carboxylic ester hydrolase n=1 Tax=Periconia macrospinosa TaxID=97972 RepID=A0A2V1DKK5_9PLEO|nr:alpha/beta-hydrolase [Periconia macrospinosa]
MWFKGSAAALCVLGVGSGAGAYPFLPRGTSSFPVDLGYAVYEGTRDLNNSINVFKGIRYAAPPLGNLRFAAPQPPAANRTGTQLATSDPPICPQTGASKETPAAYGFKSALGNEDCLFLNVYAPADASDLPVFFWIHGGGYGLFSATGLDPTEIMTTNGNGFISVIIQYRLGAFGFLAGDQVKEHGALNAGLLDMNLALKWVQENIKKFGGDPNRVTIAGESAGAGAVMYQAMAYGGAQNESLFNNIIAASPWVPYQHGYNDAFPTAAYNDFAGAAGCRNSTSTLQCLREADTVVLQNASAQVSEAGPFGTFAFTPVTDGDFVQQSASKQLVSKALSGKRILSANMANEGIPLSPPYTKTLHDFRNYINITFPLFLPDDKLDLEKQYSYDGDDQSVNPSAPLFATDGTNLPSSVNQSAFGTGQQQRVFNVFAEQSFDCPSYWFASAFPQAWKYQFSGLPAYHGFDLQALWSKTHLPGQSFKHAFRKIWGNFIIDDDPTITVADAQGGDVDSIVPIGKDGVLINWPLWDDGNPQLLSLNTTGGVAKLLNVTEYLKYYTYSDPGVVNVIQVADADTWEGGRGERCKWWLEHAAKVPY